MTQHLWFFEGKRMTPKTWTNQVKSRKIKINFAPIVHCPSSIVMSFYNCLCHFTTNTMSGITILAIFSIEHIEMIKFQGFTRIKRMAKMFSFLLSLTQFQYELISSQDPMKYIVYSWDQMFILNIPFNMIALESHSNCWIKLAQQVDEKTTHIPHHSSRQSFYSIRDKLWFVIR